MNKTCRSHNIGDRYKPITVNHSFTVFKKYLLSLSSVLGHGDAALNTINTVLALRSFSPELKAILHDFKCGKSQELQVQSVTGV